ncbi:DnaJ domain-containing protein [Agromyces sp. Marseille-P2726]|uniref:J domain-containing protein n=1 Tax=Agromyces sp. Marseille-P2726 TaxID=2709132 RepID=UPI0015712604|nr:DnaJ domain-containing protein [Agromyces sp. Marseille-P2726]
MRHDDHYETLGITPGASAEAVEAALTERAFATHPDLVGNRRTTREHARVVSAGEVLTDPARRAAYDAQAERARERRKIPRWVAVVAAIIVPAVVLTIAAAMLGAGITEIPAASGPPAVLQMVSLQMVIVALVVAIVLAYLPRRSFLRRSFAALMVTAMGMAPVTVSPAGLGADGLLVLEGALLMGLAVLAGGELMLQLIAVWARKRWVKMLELAERANMRLLYAERALLFPSHSQVLGYDLRAGEWRTVDLWGRVVTGYWQLVDDRGVVSVKPRLSGRNQRLTDR